MPAKQLSTVRELNHGAIIEVEAPPSVIAEIDWHLAPVADCERRLAAMKKIYESALTIVMARKQAMPQVSVCWSRSHTDIVPAHVLAQCKGQMAEGREAFRDYGAMDENDNRYTAFCCGQLCYTVYNKFKGEQRQRDRTGSVRP